MFCPHCGTSLPDGTHFCSQCGTRIHNAPPARGMQGGGAEQYRPQQQYAQQQQPYQSFSQQEPSPAAWQSQPGSAPYPSAAPAAPTGPLRTDRDVVMYALLTIVTCGIYGFWFVYTMAQDANTLCEGDGEETPGLGIFILLSIVTCGIYSYYWQYKLANRLQANGSRYGLTIQEGGSDVILWLVLGTFVCFICSFIAMNIIITNMNTMSMAYNRAHGYLE